MPETDPSVQQSQPVTPDPSPACAPCGHPKGDHSGRRDHKPSAIVPRRPWCHACNATCDYEPNDDFQDRGEAARQAAGIDGTAGDAQDVAHAYVQNPEGGCLLCGLAESHRKHTS